MRGIYSAFDALLEELNSELRWMYEQLLRREEVVVVDGAAGGWGDGSGASFQEAIQREVRLFEEEIKPRPHSISKTLVSPSSS